MAESNATQVILTDDGIKIIKAQTTADNAASGVTNLNDPNLMSVIEKQYNISQFAGLTSQYNVVIQGAEDDGIDTTAVTAAYNNLNRFMADILADPDHASDVDRTTYKKYQDAYNEELAKIQNSLQNSANNKFTSAANATSQAASTANDAKSAADSAYAYASSEIAIQSSATANAQSTANSAFSQAQSAITTANSTASAFGSVKQNADSALSTALNAQTDASSAVAKASSAAADSKDAEQIAGAVSQSYKTLTDGSTMTIAELQNGLAAKLTKNDLDGYATEDWAQNQIKTTADGINGTISSIKSTVDSHTTSINDLKADSNGFKDEFTKVNNVIGQHTTDISTLKADASSLSSNFDSLSSDNTTNKHDIGQLQASAKEFNSTLETVQTQVQNSVVGTNLIVQSDLKPGYLDRDNDNVVLNGDDFHSDNYISTNGATVFTLSSPDYTFKGNTNTLLKMYDSDKNYLGYQTITSATQTLSKPNVAYIRLSVYFVGEGGTSGKLSDWLSTHRYKLEKGSVATDFSLNPVDTATVTAVSSLSQTVDGFKTDISKKLEQKDLNGYATQDWAQNQIKTTADGINGTISSIKSTVDSHTTSINDFQSDSENFKSQFTKVNGTLSQQSTDISTLKADASSLSSNFDSLSSDSKTNQHDIGQLQASAKEFSSTLETVQTQVDNSAVGTNLLLNSNFSSGLNRWAVNGDCQVTATTDSDGDTCIHITGTGTGGSWGVWCSPVSFNQNQVTTASVLVKGTGTPWLIGLEGRPSSTFGTISAESYSKVGSTMQAEASTNNFVIYFASVQGVLDVYVKFAKLEVGSRATDYSVNPEDTATVMAVSSISQTIDSIKTTVSDKVDGKTYQSDMKEMSGMIASKVSTTDFDNLKISNRNLALGTATPFKVTGNNTVNQSQNAYALSKTIPRGTLVTVSFDVSSTTGVGTFIMQFNGIDSGGSWQGMDNDNLTNGTKHVSVTITTDANQSHAFFRVDNATGDIAVSNFIISESSKEVSWTPAPEDQATESQFTQLSGDIDLRVKKDDLISDINAQAGNILISASHQLILSSNTIYFDTANPVIIPSANISTLLVNKTLTAADISANTFSTNNRTFTVESDGSITAKNMTLIGGTLNTSTINGATLNMQTDGIINSPYTGIEQTADQFYHPWKLNTGQLTIGQGYITSVSSGTRSINGVPTQFNSLQGTLSASYLKFTNDWNERTYMDAEMITCSSPTNSGTQVAINSTGNISINTGTASAPALTIGSGYIDATSSSSYGTFGAITLGYNAHTINSDSSLFFETGHGSGNPGINIWAKGFQSMSSRLSTKRQVRLLDDEHSNSLLLGADTATFQYNQDTNADNSNEGVIIDDVNTVKQYNLPDELITRDGKAPTDLMSFIARVISQNKYQARLIEDLQIRLRKVEINNE